MKGISSKGLNIGGNDPGCGCPNKKGYNGNEIQNTEFSDGSGLEVYDFNARTYDQQIGRFIQIDPLIEEGNQETLTPYHFGGNNPILYNDPDGECPWCIIPILVGLLLNSQPANPPSSKRNPTQEDLDRWNEAKRDQEIGLITTFTPARGAPGPSAVLRQVAKEKAKSEAKELQNKVIEKAKKFNGENDTQSGTNREALRKAKDQNGIPRSQQPDRTIKPNTPEGDKAGLDNRNIKQYEYTNSKGEKVIIRQDKPATYKNGSQPPHFNAGKGPVARPKDLKQHHNIEPWNSWMN